MISNFNRINCISHKLTYWKISQIKKLKISWKLKFCSHPMLEWSEGGGRPVQPWHTLCANADCARFVFLLYCFPFCHLQFCSPYPLSSVSLSNYVKRSVHPSSDTPPFNTVPSGSANLRCFSVALFTILFLLRVFPLFCDSILITHSLSVWNAKKARVPISVFDPKIEGINNNSPNNIIMPDSVPDPGSRKSV